MKFLQLSLTVLFLISTYLVNLSIAARFGGGSRSSARTGSRAGSGYRTSVPYRSGIRAVSSRYTSSNNFNSANRFRSTNGVYRYGPYSGNRFGTQIRSTLHLTSQLIYNLITLCFFLINKEQLIGQLLLFSYQDRIVIIQ